MSSYQSHKKSTELAQIANSLAKSGLLESGSEEIEHDLGLRLRQELLGVSLQGKQLPEWAQGALGPVDFAKRFIEFQKSAIYAELCDPKKKRLKPKYARLLSPNLSKVATIVGLAGVIKVVLNLSAPQVAVPAVAVYMALWLLRVDLEHWCRVCSEERE